MTEYDINIAGWEFILEFGYGLYLYSKGSLRRAVNVKSGRIVLEYTVLACGRNA